MRSIVGGKRTFSGRRRANRQRLRNDEWANGIIWSYFHKFLSAEYVSADDSLLLWVERDMEAPSPFIRRGLFTLREGDLIQAHHTTMKFLGSVRNLSQPRCFIYEALSKETDVEKRIYAFPSDISNELIEMCLIEGALILDAIIRGDKLLIFYEEETNQKANYEERRFRVVSPGDNAIDEKASKFVCRIEDQTDLNPLFLYEETVLESRDGKRKEVE